MEIKLEVKNENVEITKDNSAFNFTNEELEKLLEAFIEGTVDFKGLADDDYQKYKGDPYVELIYGIYNSSDKDSDFRKKLDELEKEKTDNEKQLEELE